MSVSTPHIRRWRENIASARAHKGADRDDGLVRARDLEQACDCIESLFEQVETLDQWSRDVLPQLSRLIDIIEGRHEEARLVAPHGQTSATPHALLDRWRNLHSNPASRQDG